MAFGVGQGIGRAILVHGAVCTGCPIRWVCAAKVKVRVCLVAESEEEVSWHRGAVPLFSAN